VSATTSRALVSIGLEMGEFRHCVVIEHGQRSTTQEMVHASPNVPFWMV
jgi:hypothetical protein